MASSILSAFPRHGWRCYQTWAQVLAAWAIALAHTKYLEPVKQVAIKHTYITRKEHRGIQGSWTPIQLNLIHDES